MIADIPPAPWLAENFYFTPQHIKYLGKGTTGLVYEMISKKNNAHYAVKIIFFRIDHDLERNLKEIKLVKELSHPNIVKTFDYHHWKSPPHQYLYLVNELGNETLNFFLKKKKKLSELEFYEIVDQLIEAVYECHQKNIVHFDIKPDNIIMFDDKKIKIADFGSALKLMGNGTLPLLTNLISMTQMFASPELLKITKDFHNFNKMKNKYNWGKMDVFSLGLTFLTIIGVESDVFDNLKTNFQEEPIYDAKLKEIIESIVVKQGFQNDWINLLFSMLRLSPSKRYSIEDVKLSLKNTNSTNSNREIVHQLIVEQSTIDLVFVLDTTGSMDKYVFAILDSLKHHIGEMRKIKARRKVRVGFIFYKDKPTKIDNTLMNELVVSKILSKEAFTVDFVEQRSFLQDLRPYNDYINILELTDDINFIEKKLSQIQCCGGGDECEDLTEALNSALTLDWTPSNKMKTVVIITDAPTHGKSYHGGNSLDDYLEDDEKFDNLEEIVRKLCKKEIGIMGLEISKKTKKMYKVIEKTCKKHNGLFSKSLCTKKIQETQLRINYWFKLNFLEEIDSIFSKQYGIYLKDKICDSIDWDKQIDWNQNFESKSSMGISTKKYSAEIIKQTLDFYHLNQLMLCINETDEKFQGLIMNKSIMQGSQMRIYLFLMKSNNQKTVVKIPLKNDPVFKTTKDLEKYWKIYLLTQLFLEKFNAELNINNDSEKLKHLDLIALKIKGETFQEYKFLLCEQFLDGIFVKYNNNNGSVQELKKGVTYETNLLCQSFSHFSYVHSKGRIIICDLQGVGNILTDPAINSVEQIFGNTDLGQYGIYKFFKTHVCNKYCFQLNLEPTENIMKDYKNEQGEILLEQNSISDGGKWMDTQIDKRRKEKMSISSIIKNQKEEEKDEDSFFEKRKKGKKCKYSINEKKFFSLTSKENTQVFGSSSSEFSLKREREKKIDFSSFSSKKENETNFQISSASHSSEKTEFLTKKTNSICHSSSPSSYERPTEFIFKKSSSFSSSYFSSCSSSCERKKRTKPIKKSCSFSSYEREKRTKPTENIIKNTNSILFSSSPFSYLSSSSYERKKIAKPPEHDNIMKAKWKNIFAKKNEEEDDNDSN